MRSRTFGAPATADLHDRGSHASGVALDSFDKRAADPSPRADQVTLRAVMRTSVVASASNGIAAADTTPTTR